MYGGLGMRERENKKKKENEWGVVAAQLVARTLKTLEIRGSIPASLICS